MSHLHQLKVKLLNALTTGEEDLIDSTIDEIFDAMGGCEKCFGRGYLVIHKTGKLCDCERAEQLKGFIKNYGMPKLPV